MIFHWFVAFGYISPVDFRHAIGNSRMRQLRPLILELLDVSNQFIQVRHPHEVEAHHLVGPKRWLLACPQRDQQARDDSFPFRSWLIK